MYVRFVVDEIDEYSGVELGIFQATYRLWRAGKLNASEEAWWAEVRAWFNLELEKPARLTRSRRAGAEPCAISWFKTTAVEHIRRAREVMALLAEHDVQSRMLRSERPGYIVYEDDFQVTAEPFRPEHR